MIQVIKRDGEIAEFNLSKITEAIKKAFRATNKDYTEEILQLLSLRVTADFQAKMKDGKISVEEIQDSAEHVLEETGYTDVAKAYILYRKQRERIRNMKNTILDYKDVVNSYVKVEDWRVKENSTVTYSVGGLILSNSGAITANYWLSEIYDTEIAEAHRSAAIHLHDLSMLTGYCAGWSLKQLIQDGLGGIPGKITSSPAKHLSVLCNQMVNFLGIMQNEWAGAQAFSSFDTYLAPFVKVDNLDYPAVKKCIEAFIYGVNTPSRWGTQAPFSNITLDWTVPDDMMHMPAIVGGKNMDFTYGDCKKEMDMINKAFIETMVEGDANGRGFQYPIPTYSITRDFDWSDTENNRLLFEMTSKYGTPYFSNYINSDMQPSDVRSMCCRLRLDLRELRKKTGGFFGSGESTGSVGVVTINIPRIAYLAKDEQDFYARLDKMMDISARSLKIKREVITKLLDSGLYPYTKQYLGTFNNHFSTIGLIGMNEACLNAKWIRQDITNEKALQFTKDVLNHMRERLVSYQEEYGDLYNLEATPAESTTYRLAKHDKEKYPDIITAGEADGTPYYTNSSHLPVSFTADVFDALDLQDELHTLYTSGTVFHAFLGEKLPDWKAAAKLVRTIAENYKLPYYTLSPTYSICKEHGYLIGEHYTCPICGQKAEVYSRITGYYRPVQNWNDGKTQEYKERKVYDIKHSVLKRNPDASKTILEAINEAKSSMKAEHAAKQESAVPAAGGDGVFLFTTKTCPNCKIAKQFLKDEAYQVVDAEENPALTDAYGIMQAPTLVIVKDGSIQKFVNASNIKKYVDSKK
ncbi:MAG: ribonucleoside triphosphate reductase [Lachnoclostridium sp.]|nr:ribonucleoside triphosphate reductase [Lachnoclostridium sp.]